MATIKVYNGSKTAEVYITLKNISGSNIFTEDRLILPNESLKITTIDSIVKLEVHNYNNGDRLQDTNLLVNLRKNVWWEGLIPTESKYPIIINSENQTVLYGESQVPGVNISKINQDNNYSEWYIICIILIIAIILLCFYLFWKKN